MNRQQIVNDAIEMTIKNGFDADRVRAYAAIDSAVQQFINYGWGEWTTRTMAEYLAFCLTPDTDDGGQGQADYVPMGSLYNIHPRGR